MYGHSYWCNENRGHQALTCNIKATFCFIYGPTNLKICLELALYMPHNQSIYVDGGWATSQLLEQKTNLKKCAFKDTEVKPLNSKSNKRNVGLLESVGKIQPDHWCLLCRQTEKLKVTK
jgi:hypothetical protein